MPINIYIYIFLKIKKMNSMLLFKICSVSYILSICCMLRFDWRAIYQSMCHVYINVFWLTQIQPIPGRFDRLASMSFALNRVFCHVVWYKEEKYPFLYPKINPAKTLCICCGLYIFAVKRISWLKIRKNKFVLYYVLRLLAFTSVRTAVVYTLMYVCLFPL